MNSYTNTQSESLSSGDKVLAASLALLSTFILGYSATRVVLNVATSSATQSETVIPHQASGWSALGEHSFQ